MPALVGRTLRWPGCAARGENDAAAAVADYDLASRCVVLDAATSGVSSVRAAVSARSASGGKWCAAGPGRDPGARPVPQPDARRPHARAIVAIAANGLGAECKLGCGLSFRTRTSPTCAPGGLIATGGHGLRSEREDARNDGERLSGVQEDWDKDVAEAIAAQRGCAHPDHGDVLDTCATPTSIRTANSPITAISSRPWRKSGRAGRSTTRPCSICFRAIRPSRPAVSPVCRRACARADIRVSDPGSRAQGLGSPAAGRAGRTRCAPGTRD